MATTTLTIMHGRASDFRGQEGMSARTVANHFAALFHGCVGGIYEATGFTVAQTAAEGTVTLSSASGTVGATINGVATTVAASGGDAATATALAAAINGSANPLVSAHVLAVADGAVVRVAARSPGAVGNAVTLAASGTGLTASGARLTGGVSLSFTF